MACTVSPGDILSRPQRPLSHAHPSPAQASLSAESASAFDGSAIVLWLMAVGTLVAGSLWSGADYAAERRDRSSSPSGESSSNRVGGD
jgi:hypothetical protein